MATSQQQLSFAIRAINEASATLKAVSADVDGLGAKAEASDGKLGKLGGALGTVGKIAGGFVLGSGLLQLPGLLSGMVQGALDDEAATLRLNKALDNYIVTTGGASEETQELIGDMNERIKAAQRLAFGDDDVRDSMQKLLAATGDYGEATERQAAAMDLARGAGIPLAQASTLLGKITEDNVEVFKRMGITIGEGATEADALAAVQAKFGGQAEQYAKSTAGQFDSAKIRIGEAQEAIGGALLPVFANFLTFIVERALPGMEALVEKVGPGVKKAVDLAKGAIEFLTPIIQENFARFMTYYEESIKPAQDNIVAGFQAVVGWVQEHWPEIWAVLGPAFANIKVVAETVFGTITGLIDTLIQLIGGDFTGAWNSFKGVVEGVWNGITTVARNNANAVIAIMNGLIRGWNALEFSVSIPFGPSISVGTPDIPEIPHLATGGIVRARPGGTLALLGEGGRDEAVVPLSSGGAGFGGNTYNITVLDRDGLTNVLYDLERTGRIAPGTMAVA